MHVLKGLAGAKTPPERAPQQERRVHPPEPQSIKQQKRARLRGGFVGVSEAREEMPR
jgi:hypothetical protein